MYDALLAERPDWAGASPLNDASGRIKVVMTASAEDPATFQPHRRTPARLETLAKRFKMAGSGLDVVVVVDMWLTGFDVPSLHTLYIDKPMKGPGLMEAIARVNRVFGDKPGGLVVDYLGIGAELQEALARYAGDTTDNAFVVEVAVRELLRRLEEAQALLDPAPWRAFGGGTSAKRLEVLKACMEHILARGRRAEFNEAVAKVETAFALAAGTEEAVRARDDVALAVAIRAGLTRRTRGMNGSGKAQAEQRVKQLLSRAVVSDGILDVFTAAVCRRPTCRCCRRSFWRGYADMSWTFAAIAAARSALLRRAGYA